MFRGNLRALWNKFMVWNWRRHCVIIWFKCGISHTNNMDYQLHLFVEDCNDIETMVWWIDHKFSFGRTPFLEAFFPITLYVSSKDCLMSWECSALIENYHLFSFFVLSMPRMFVWLGIQPNIMIITCFFLVRIFSFDFKTQKSVLRIFLDLVIL